MEPKFILQSGGSLTMMEIKLENGKEIKFLDLMKFFGQPISLEEACQSYGVPIKKGSFPYDFLNEHKNIYYVGKEPEPRYYKKGHEPETFDLENENWNLRDKCLEYLLNDITMTTELYKKMSTVFWERFKVNMNDFITVQQMSYAIWASTIIPNTSLKTSTTWNCDYPMPDITSFPKIFIPNQDLYEISYEAIYGGRVYPNKREFESRQYEWIKNGEVLYDDIQEDYITMFDVCSLYPFAMKNNKYPIGKERKLREFEIIIINEKLFNDKSFRLEMGIYLVFYIPNKHLLNPVLPRKHVKKDVYGKLTASGLIWDLVPSEGRYTSVDLNLALDKGYTINVKEAVVWDESYPIFNTFIDIMFDMKQKAEEEKNEAIRTCAKIQMNSLYGKFSQKLFTEDVIICSQIDSASKFIFSHDITEVIPIRNHEREVLGVIFKGKQPAIKSGNPRPNYISAFILAYSRKKMWEYFDLVCPNDGKKEFFEENLENLYFYGDTDSFHVKCTPEIMQRLQPFIKNNQLGYICNDLKKDQGKIIKAEYVGPKTYWIEWIGKDNVIRNNGKCKGIPRCIISPELFFNLKTGQANDALEFQSFKIMGAHHTPTQEPWRIFTTMLSRSFLKYFLNGRMFNHHQINKPSLPIGFKKFKGLENFVQENLD
ncbi:MAG: DNA polymerase [Nitrososphaerota archaeon]